jgi:hypothetical protein
VSNHGARIETIMKLRLFEILFTITSGITDVALSVALVMTKLSARLVERSREERVRLTWLRRSEIQDLLKK